MDFTSKKNKLQEKLGVITYEKYELLENELAQTKERLHQKESEYDCLQDEYNKKNRELVRIKSGRGKAGGRIKNNHRSKKKTKK